MKKKLILAVITLVILFSFSACNKLDVIGDTSIKSFGKVLDAEKDKVTKDEAYGTWSLAAPDGSARFLWSMDYSKSSKYDIMLETDVQPFIDAGLDTGRLPEGMIVGDKLVVGQKLGNDSLNYDGEATPLKSYEKIVSLYRDNLKYHTALDHFGIDLSNGNTFEFAKNMEKNDKDIVFVLNPQVLIDAGVNPDKVEGWVFAKVQTMDAKGKKITVDKFLKPFNLVSE